MVAEMEVGKLEFKDPNMSLTTTAWESKYNMYFRWRIHLIFQISLAKKRWDSNLLMDLELRKVESAG